MSSGVRATSRQLPRASFRAPSLRALSAPREQPVDCILQLRGFYPARALQLRGSLFAPPLR
eukprot:2196894-Alexandrium_andersonii.AAC.1